jgi:hypothetical protein
MKIFNIDEFSKKIVWLLLINSIIWIYLSYALAFLGKEQIAENLSTTVVIQILGVMIVYSLKALFENISKNNSWPDKPNCENQQSENINNDENKEGI